MVNCGKEEVRVHMNVVPRSTMNTNGNASEGGKMRDPGNEVANCPRAVHQYSDMPPRLLGQAPISDVAFFVSKPLLGIERRKKLTKTLQF